MRLEYTQTLTVGNAHPTAISYLIVPCYLVPMISSDRLSREIGLIICQAAGSLENFVTIMDI